MVSSIIGYYETRREPLAPPMLTPASRNVRPTLNVNAQQPYTPPRQGDIPSQPARWPIVTFQSVSDWLGVMRDSFISPVPLWAPANLADTTSSPSKIIDSQQPMYHRVNIERETPPAYGTLIALSTDDKYRLLMGGV